MVKIIKYHDIDFWKSDPDLLKNTNFQAFIKEQTSPVATALKSISFQKETNTYFSPVCIFR